MTSLLLCLVCIFPTAPAPVVDTFALITADAHGEVYQWPVVISQGTVIRAPIGIRHVTGWQWSRVKGECRAMGWPVLEFPIRLEKQRPRVRFRLCR